jgi:hypothetical protein
MKEEVTKAEKLDVLRQDQAWRRFNTLHGRAQADAAMELGGRFREALPTPTVVGATPISYPRMPTNSPWAEGIDQISGIEPPTGYDINSIDIGEPAVSSLAVGHSTCVSTQSADAVEITPSPLLVEVSAASSFSEATSSSGLRSFSSTKLRRL